MVDKWGQTVWVSTTVVSLIFGIVGVVFATLQYLSTPRSSLQAVVHSYPHHSLTDWEYINDVIDRSEQQDLSFFGVTIYALDNVRGVYDIILLNSGNTVAKSVRVFVDGAIGMMISRNNNQSFAKGDEVNIGDINPNEEVEVISWTRRHTNWFYVAAQDISITHDNGVIELDYRYEIEGIFRFLDKHKVKILFTISGLLFVISIFVAIFRQTVRQPTQADDVSIDDKNGS